jgi:hypothetical protein
MSDDATKAAERIAGTAKNPHLGLDSWYPVHPGDDAGIVTQRRAYHADILAVVADRDRLARELECEEADHRDQCAENARLAAENERLRAACEAMVADEENPEEYFDQSAFDRMIGNARRLARAALAHDTTRKDGE